MLQWKIQYLDDLCYTEFLGYYRLENKSSKTSQCEPNELDDNLIENNHEEYFYPQKIRRNNALSRSKANPSISCAK